MMYKAGIKINLMPKFHGPRKPAGIITNAAAPYIDVTKLSRRSAT